MTRMVASEYGSISIRSGDEITGLDAARRIAEVSVYRWIPSARIQTDVPPGFPFEMGCLTGRDSVRRFFPCIGYGDLINRAWAGGLAILADLQEMHDSTRRSHSENWFLFQKFRRSIEHFGRKFQWSRDLYVRPSGRVTDDERNVLPANLGSDANGRGTPWSITQLVERGTEAAIAAGCTRPNKELVLQFGVFEAARLSPLDVSDDQALTLVRCALFDIGPPVELNAKQFDDLQLRIRKALDAHLDDHQADFDAWFWGRNSSFIKQVAKQKRSAAGAVSPETARAVLLELGWQAYRSVSDCLQAQLRCFQNVLPQPLLGAERYLFEQTYLPQPHFGGLSLPLLAERLDFLAVPLKHSWTTPSSELDDHLAGVILRMLTWYGQMSGARRGADRLASREYRRKKSKPSGSEDTPISDDSPAASDAIEE